MYILGISCFRNNSAACILHDDKLVAACEEERFSRKKSDSSFPFRSILYCLKESGIGIKDLNYAGFFDNNHVLLKRARIALRKIGYNKEPMSFSIEESYMAAAFYPSPFSKAAVLVNGDEDVGLFTGFACGNKIKPIKHYNFSLAKMYSDVTAYLGFRPGADDYKVMGLAAYGKPRYKDLFLKGKIKIPGIPPRGPKQKITQPHMDIAASIQRAAEDKVLEIVRRLRTDSKVSNLCLSGSMALNCAINTKILEQGLFSKLWIQPAAGDAGAALGAAYLIRNQLLNYKRRLGFDAMKGAFLGEAYSDGYIEEFLRQEKIHFVKHYYGDIPKITARLISQGKVVGWFQGRAEFGPRALGARSILADSRNLNMHDRINLRVKFREPFRPLAPSVLEEFADKYFYLRQESPYMLLIARVKKDKERQIPAVVHVDKTSRAQTIKRRDNTLYYDTIKEFYRLTGCPVIINTSFNRRNEPIVLAPEDAYRVFKATDMDSLVMGRFVLSK